MDPPTYSTLAAPDHVSPEMTDSGERQASRAGPSSASPARAGPSATSGVSLLLTPLEGRSTFLSGRLLPRLSSRNEDGSSATVVWVADRQPVGLEASAVSEVSGEVMTKGVKPDRVERL